MRVPRYAHSIHIIRLCGSFLFHRNSETVEKRRHRVVPMDPGTIIAVIVTTTQVLSLLTKYYQGVHDARTDVERLKSEIQSFQHVLQKIQELLKSSNGTRLSASSSQITAIAHSVSSLEELKDKLDPSHGKRIMKRVGLRALKWPLTKQEVNEYMIHLERCKGTLNLAFEADHM